jgi:adenylate kinase family enzyme
MPQKILNKIIITGDAGRGKTGLAKRLSEKLGIPYYSTDDYYYEVKFTKPRDKQESVDGVSKVYKEEKWIVEGTTEHLIAPGLDSADLVICLKYNNIFAQWIYLIKRHFHHEITGSLWDILRHVFYKRYGLGYRRGLPTIYEFVAPYNEKLVTLSSFKEMNNFLHTL